ncbi:hypothetical protein DERF_014381 [Dermatophagoides farinae]|uniref:Uncharacterized protein n=1 Tax=Dermatophagoides farinae TaxID=6954 RepID=A0A922HHS3_DERFA|nr:hypothetical protein DERF_014381 [Dermatophagoides farinae]
MEKYNTNVLGTSIYPSIDLKLYTLRLRKKGFNQSFVNDGDNDDDDINIESINRFQSILI